MKLEKQELYIPTSVENRQIPMPEKEDVFLIYDEGSIGHMYEEEQPFEVATHWLKKEEKFVLSEEELKEHDEAVIKDFLKDMMSENPVKFLQYAMCVIGRDIYKSNATDFTFSQEQNAEDGKRIEVKIKGTIKPVNTKQE